MTSNVTEQFRACIAESAAYPGNLAPNSIHPHTAAAFRERLKIGSRRLFKESSQYSQRGQHGPPVKPLRFYDVRDHQGDECQPVLLADIDALRTHLSTPDRDPLCRAIILRAPSQRSELCTSLETFKLFMTYHLVMPAFLEFVFPFGKQTERPNPYVGGFRTNQHFEFADEAMGRSQRQIELCYTLQAPERTGDLHDPWAIRQCSVWHSFDLEQERQTWIVVKANGVVENIVKHHIKRFRADTSRLTALRMALDSHLDICQWSGENWQWYLTFLEEEMNESLKDVDTMETSRKASGRFIGNSMSSPSQGVSRAVTVASGRPWLASIMGSADPSADVEMGLYHDPEPIAASPVAVSQPRSFSFEDLQRLQSKEELASNAKIILQGNLEVATQLQREFQRSRQLQHIGEERRTFIATFEERMVALQVHLKVLLDRSDAYLKLVSGKKEYMSALLQYENMCSTRKNTEEAKQISAAAMESAKNMEAVTDEMHKIAKRTEGETVRMRIITAVTLFFLPGTFVSTLMSTAIVSFSEPPEANGGITDTIIRSGALQLYVILSLPLMFLTFMSWYIMAWLDANKGGALGRCRQYTKTKRGLD